MGLLKKLFGTSTNLENTSNLHLNKPVSNLPVIKNNFNIPDNTFNLLWIDEGDQNREGAGYALLLDESSEDTDDLTISMRSYGAAEPSVIFTRLAIRRPRDLQDVPDLGYYPSYKGLTPEQRWIYLSWLQDNSKAIQVGYVYIYYYGLERHLVVGKFESAVSEIIKLNKFHSGIHRYSQEAILYSCLLRKDYQRLKIILESMENRPIDNFGLLIKLHTNSDLSVNDLFELIGQLKGINKRYIKNKPEVYLEELGFYLKSKFNSSYYPFNEIFSLKDAPLEKSLVFANISLPENIRSRRIPNLFNHNKFIKEMEKIHETVHDVVKKKSMKSRKKNN